MPGPGGVSGWRPAALNISGTPFATPSPTRNSPASAAAGCPISSIAPSGMPVEQRAPAQQRDGPDAVVDPVADDAADGHAGGEERVRERGQRGAGAEVLAQVEAAPVGHRALGDHHEEAEDRQQHDAARGQREARRVRSLRRRPVPDPGGRDGEQREQQQRGDRDGHARVDAERRERRGEAGARHAAERPAGVQRGHDRPPQVLLHLDAVAVHGNVLRRAGGAEHGEPERDEQRVRREHGQVDGERARDAAGPDDPLRAVADDRLPRDREGEDDGERHAEDDQAHGGLGQVEALLHPGDVRDPAADRRAVDGEDGGGGPARGHARVTVTPSAR